MSGHWHPRREVAAALVLHTDAGQFTIEATGDALRIAYPGGVSTYPLSEIFRKLDIQPSVIADALCEAWR